MDVFHNSIDVLMRDELDGCEWYSQEPMRGGEHTKDVAPASSFLSITNIKPEEENLFFPPSSPLDSCFVFIVFLVNLALNASAHPVLYM